MNAWQDISRKALRGALTTRRRGNVAKDAPDCIYDLASKLGVETQFAGGSSFGGMYTKTSQTILIPALRPVGRQAFTCAHELGHWFFDHGTRVDDLRALDTNDTTDPDERLANLYAGFLLAPSWAVRKVFSDHAWDMATASPTQIYTAAGQLGIGYSTLVYHLAYSLGYIAQNDAERLLATTPKQIRRHLLGDIESRHLVIIDHHWNSVPIDLAVGDYALLPAGADVEGLNVTRAFENENGTVFRAHAPGMSRAEQQDQSWASYIRVSRASYTGRAKYRHLEDPDVDSAT